MKEDEASLVKQSHYPQLAELADDDIRQLLDQLRERRSRARNIASQQRRELRGKSAPVGIRPATDDAGSREKLTLLAAAVQRVNKEQSRRGAFAARAELIGNAERALELRRSAFRSHHPRPSRTASKGMRAKPNTRRPRIAEPMEVGRVSQFVKAAQVRRDTQ
ncbi:hypothetical protein [Chthonobacter rhizosphaerae]|uniref:hypothetical protein n=1 Tax=Chthonobacter rhizosphaerae TaxID=2735553 RepID=UPI0015EE5C7E|nr:hypothetical protein [Chthonobacter rhizosphaerae]